MLGHAATHRAADESADVAKQQVPNCRTDLGFIRKKPRLGAVPGPMAIVVI